jgi:hypothetical protein
MFFNRTQLKCQDQRLRLIDSHRMSSRLCFRKLNLQSQLAFQTKKLLAGIVGSRLMLSQSLEGCIIDRFGKVSYLRLSQ